MSLYVIDHSGHNPVSPYELLAYSMPFQKILGACTLSVDALTNEMIWLSNKASELGARLVSNLDMLQSIANRIHWKGPHDCLAVFNLAEGHLEAGVH
jgi:hypothetical protein